MQSSVYTLQTLLNRYAPLQVRSSQVLQFTRTFHHRYVWPLRVCFFTNTPVHSQLHSLLFLYMHSSVRSLLPVLARLLYRCRLALIIIMYIYHALINAQSAHIIHINLNMIFYTHIEHSPTRTIYIKYYIK